jgi:hypothetical protein
MTSRLLESSFATIDPSMQTATELIHIVVQHVRSKLYLGMIPSAFVVAKKTSYGIWITVDGSVPRTQKKRAL